MKMSDLLGIQLEVYRQLKDGHLSIAEAQARTRVLQNATKQVQLLVDHARFTGRLETGSDNLPDFQLPTLPVESRLGINGEPVEKP